MRLVKARKESARTFEEKSMLDSARALCGGDTFMIS
jgi:hypothetical protein